MKVWSGEVGYPGEPNYLDFHKKEGDSKLRYWRVTDIKIDMGEKQLYNPEWVWEKVDKQSHDFIKQIERVAHQQKTHSGKIATVCTPFDTELFGHWWYEGLKFLEKMFEGIHQSPSIGLTTCSEQMQHHSGEHINLSEGSWGKNNDHTVWMNDLNKWCWELSYNAEKKLLDLKSKYNHTNFTNKLSESIFKQAIVTLQLILSSDWQFLIETDSATDYSEMRMSNHYSDLLRLINYLNKIENGLELDTSESKDLEAIQSRDDLFDEISASSYLEI
jgi:1,4-alpha-glucan branching enzyme